MLSRIKAYLTRLRWWLQPKRYVRIQLKENRGAIDGILTGIFAGHYRLENAYFYEHKVGAVGNELVGTTWIPRKEVLLLQQKKQPY